MYLREIWTLRRPIELCTAMAVGKRELARAPNAREPPAVGISNRVDDAICSANRVIPCSVPHRSRPKSRISLKLIRTQKHRQMSIRLHQHLRRHTKRCTTIVSTARHWTSPTRMIMTISNSPARQVDTNIIFLPIIVKTLINSKMFRIAAIFRWSPITQCSFFWPLLATKSLFLYKRHVLQLFNFNHTLSDLWFKFYFTLIIFGKIFPGLAKRESTKRIGSAHSAACIKPNDAFWLLH